ncbi:FAD-dependent oxidoreductase [Piscinibacter sakaiensis]|uniref:FAD-dependent oxidoreductase n=1 Tax=Piscinibacter sakaiensis TaxID=1547922 RepID=UPI00372CD9B6
MDGARRDAAGHDAAPERLMLLVNAPARALAPAEIESCRHATWDRLRRCGLLLPTDTPAVTTTPSDFARRFPGSQGAIYGAPSHGWRASFTRPGSTGPLPGLVLAGGTVHPGPGVPMAALSGRLAAAHCLSQARRVSTTGWRPTPMPGGTSTR